MTFGNSAASLKPLIRLRDEDMFFWNTIESLVSSTFVKSKECSEELLKSLNKASETNKSTNESSTKHTHEMSNLGGDPWQQINDSVQYQPSIVNDATLIL